MVLIALWIVELTSSWWQRMHSLMFLDAAVAMVFCLYIFLLCCFVCTISYYEQLYLTVLLHSYVIWVVWRRKECVGSSAIIYSAFVIQYESHFRYVFRSLILYMLLVCRPDSSLRFI